MSSEALAWAFKQDCPSSSTKFTLVALCECANYKTGRIYPSIEHITEITGQNRKTVISNISELERLGFIADTGERMGRTKQIKVYQASLGTVPRAEQSQERNSTEKVPEQSQKRDTEPSRTIVDKAKALPTARAKPAKPKWQLPDWIPSDAWEGFEEMRKLKGKQMTNRARDGIVSELQKLRGPPGAILDQSTRNNWLDVYELKDKQNGQSRNTDDGMGRTERAAERLKQHLSGGAGRTEQGATGFAALQSGPGNRTIDAQPNPVRAIGYVG